MLAAIADEAFKAINPENMVLVVNKAPEHYNAIKALRYYELMRKTVKNCTLPALTVDHILVLPRIEHIPQEEGDFEPTIQLSEQFKKFLESKIPPESQTITA